MQSLENSSKQDKDSLFYFPKKKTSVLPGHHILNLVIKKGWKHPDKRVDLGSRFKSVYRPDPADYDKWDTPAKVDLAVANLSRRSFFTR